MQSGARCVRRPTSLCARKNSYTKKETNGEMAEGAEEARELSAANYGRDEWWVLLDPVDE